MEELIALARSPEVYSILVCGQWENRNPELQCVKVTCEVCQTALCANPLNHVVARRERMVILCFTCCTFVKLMSPDKIEVSQMWDGVKGASRFDKPPGQT